MLRSQVEGGTNSCGVPPTAFLMPGGMRFRYDLPARELSSCVTGYAVFASSGGDPVSHWFLPSPATIVILLDADPVSVSVRHRSNQSIDRTSVVGPSNHAAQAMGRGGIAVCIGLTARGWGRLTSASATAWRNAVHPLASVIGFSSASALFAALNDLTRDDDIAATLDNMLPALLGFDHPDHMLLDAVTNLIMTQEPLDVGDVVARMGISRGHLRHLTAHYFGMPTRTLLSRARFNRSYIRWLMAGEPVSYEGIDAGYFDASHFLRDARTFLGTTPRRFAALDMPYLRTWLRARAAVIEASGGLRPRQDLGLRLAG